jgi:hypothetical protein
MASAFLKENLPIIEFDADDDIFEIDEMWLGAKQRGANGRHPKQNCIVFGNLSQLL